MYKFHSSKIKMNMCSREVLYVSLLSLRSQGGWGTTGQANASVGLQLWMKRKRKRIELTASMQFSMFDLFGNLGFYSFASITLIVFILMLRFCDAWIMILGDIFMGYNTSYNHTVFDHDNARVGLERMA